MGKDIGITCTQNTDGDKKWSLHGKLHREDGPAVEFANGSKAWYLHGELHRENGPAVELIISGKKIWWYHGENLTKKFGCTSQDTFERLLKMKAFW